MIQDPRESADRSSMSATAASFDETLRLDDDRVLVARLPVVDARMRVKGYRITYSQREDTGPCIPSGAEGMRLFNEVFSVMSLEALVGDSTGYVHASPDLLREGGLLSACRERVAVGVSYEDAVAEDLAPFMDRSFKRRSVLVLATPPSAGFDVQLLDQFGVVEIDMSSWTPRQLAAIAAELVGRRSVVHATNVPDIAHRDFARDLGFAWFSGPFLTTANIVSDRKPPVRALEGLVNVARLQSESITLEDLIKVIQRDDDLSARLLKHVNSAHFAFVTAVKSVRHAAVLLGTTEVARWAMLHSALGVAPKVSPAQMVIAMTRAGMCERLAAVLPGVTVDSMFTAGILSMADVLVGVSLDAIMAELSVRSEVKEAVLHHTGPVGGALAGVIAFERGDFNAPALAPILPHCAVAYRQALSWAQTAVSSLR